MPRKLLARFQFLAESDAYLELLEQNEIPYYLSGMGIEQEGQTNYSESLEVWVDEENFKKAVQVIKQNEYFTACPNCGSKDLIEAVLENLKSNLNPLLRMLFISNRRSSKSTISLQV
ncbi:MAG TPA: hypothetical protein VKY36_00870 [Moheibacter sp.]|nr:hypothetical protein [Moheibacter sp.]